MTEIELFRTGPITRGKIDVSPLTVLAGPNNSGKSYAAMVLHALNRENEYNERVSSLLARSVGIEEQILDDKNIEELENISKKIEENGFSPVSSEIFNRLIEVYYDGLFNIFESNLENVFSTETSELIKHGHRSIRFDLHTPIGYSKSIKYKNDDELHLEEVPKTDENPILCRESANEKTFPDDKTVVKISESDDFLLPMKPRLMKSVFEHIEKKLDLRHKSFSHYLPAGRAGLLQSHRILTRSAFDSLSSVGIEHIEVPAYSGVVSTYLGQISDFSSEDSGELEGLAEEFEREILDGKLIIEQDEQLPQPEIRFEESGSEFPLHLASTSVSELAPLILYTKYVLSRDSMVIIEEPEAHLHPENQRQVAYFIARLVNEGVRAVVTTHSDFFIEQLNHSIRLSEVDEKEKNQSELEDLPAIDPEKVSAHVFQPDEESGGYKINNVDVDGLRGIPTDEFERVTDKLYTESYEVDNLLENSQEF